MASWLDQGDIPVHLIRYEDHAGRHGRYVPLRAGFCRPFGERRGHPARRRATLIFSELRRQESEKGFSETPRRPGGLFFRRGEVGAWRDELSAEQVARIEAAHAPMMRRLGYELASAMPLARAG